MSTSVEADVARRLAELEQPDAHLLAVSGEGLIGRLYARPELRRRLPMAVTVELARLRGLVEWPLLPGRRRAALERAAVLLGPGARRGEIRRLARRHLCELAIQTELSWHPWSLAGMPIHGLEHLEAARRLGTGTILATVHMGPLLNLMKALAAHGHKLYIVGGRRPHEPPLRGHDGRWVRTQNIWVEEAGCRWVHRGGSRPLIQALLQRGEVVWMNWDARGEVPVPLLGRTVRVRSGLAALALETGATVVPTFAVREGRGQAGILLPGLQPSDYATAAELNVAISGGVEAVLRPRLAQSHAVLARQLARAT